MKTKIADVPSILLGLLFAIMVLPAGCGDDDESVNPSGGGGGSYDDPQGDWTVTSSNVNVVVDDSDVPAEIQPYIEAWLKKVIGQEGDSDWKIEMTTVFVVHTLTISEEPTCLPFPFLYDAKNRNCSTTTPVQVQDADVTSLHLCEEPVPTVEYCVTEVSIDADVTPNLTWSADFGTFGGEIKIGSAQNQASVAVTVTGPGIGGTYPVDFYASRDVSGVRCSGCSSCP
jgi:hypothetical protein